MMFKILKKSAIKDKGSPLPWPKFDGISLASDRLSRFSCFQPEAYRKRYPDIGGFPPALHFVSYGANEGRIAAEPRHLARMIGQCQQDQTKKTSKMEQAGQAVQPGSFAIFCNSLGNAFMKEIAVALSKTLRAAGHFVIELDENHPVDQARPTSIFVAPHEFFLLGKGSKWLRDDVLASAFMYCTEQPQTQWFWQILPAVLMSRGVIDISQLTASLFAEVMPAVAIQPYPFKAESGFTTEDKNHPLLQARFKELNWSADDRPYSERPIDLSFMGAVSDNRNAFFSRNARLLSNFEGFFYLRQRNAHRVLSTQIDQVDLSAIGSVIARNSKIALNVHRDEFPYFEWHRMVQQAMANGALVLSEPCFEDEQYIAGHHFLIEESRYMGQMIEWILRTKDGQEMAVNTVKQATAFLEHEVSPTMIAERIASFTATVAV